MTAENTTAAAEAFDLTEWLANTDQDDITERSHKSVTVYRHPAQLDAAIAEASGFVGFDLDEAYGDSSGPPSELAMAVCLLAQTHADSGGPADNEYRRGVAQKLLTRYRVDPGFVGVGAVADEPEGSE